MKKSMLPLLVLAIGCLAAIPAHAGDYDYDYDMYGEWRFIYSHVQEHPLNADGDPNELNWYLDHRLDVGVDQTIGDTLFFKAEVEFFYGQTDGDFDRIGADYRLDVRDGYPGWDLKNFDLRQLYVKWDLPWFQIRAGQQYSHWGLGLLANDGRPTPGRVGFQDQGDVSERLVLATRPLAMLSGWPSKIVLALGGGVVYLDENCSLRDGDLGIEILGSVFYRDEGIDVGMYVAGRIQEDEAGTELNVAAIDLFAQIDAGPGYEGLLVATEMALLTGSTSRVIQADRIEGLDISAFAAVLRAGWRFGFFDFLPMVEIGYASGDPDPHDGTITSFQFDPDYKVGLVLFDSVMRSITAMDAVESSDPNRIGEPLPGTDQLASRGRVGNVIYLNPTVSIRPLEEMTVVAGFLFAWSATPFSQSYRTFENGGVATNPYGLTNPGRSLGWELNLGFDWDQPVWNDMHIVGGLQTGWFFPGSAFDRPDGSRPGIVNRFMGRLALTW